MKIEYLPGFVGLVMMLLFWQNMQNVIIFYFTQFHEYLGKQRQQ